MATTYKPEQSKFWYARFFDGAGRRVSRSTKTESRREAKRIAAEFEAAARRESKEPDKKALALDVRRVLKMAELDFEAGTLTPARGQELLKQLIHLANPERAPSFRKIAAGWLDEAEKRCARGTWKSYRDAIIHANRILGEKADRPLDEIRPGDISEIQSGMVDAGLRGRTINQHLSTIRRIFTEAAANGLIAANPVAVRAVSAADSRRRAPFTPAEIAAMIAAAPDDAWRGAILLAATTGLRAGDIRRLTSDNVVGNHLAIRPSKTKGSTGTILKIPLHPQAAAWLQGRTGPLFPSLAPLTESQISNRFKRVMKSANVSPTIELAPNVVAHRSMHSLRHSFASMLADAGIAQDVRMRLTGHSSTVVHARYSHHDAALDAAVAALPTI